MRVSLISPYEDITALGVRSLLAFLKRAGHQAQMLFLPRGGSEGMRWDGFRFPYKDVVLAQVVDLVRESNIIGISVMTNYFDNAVQLTERLRAAVHVPIIWGGIHATVQPEECLKFADVVCLGEGEEAVCELADRMAAGADYSDVRNLWFVRDGKSVRNPLRPLIDNLDSLPYPDYDLDSHYILHNGQLERMNEDLLAWYLRFPYTSTDVVTYTTMMSRGCTYQCAYCCNNALRQLYRNQRRRVRWRNVSHLIGELAQVQSRFPFIERIKIEDDAFLANKSSIIREFSDSYRREINLPLVVTGLQPTMVSKDKLDPLVDAGLREVRMGIQTGSERVMRSVYKRPVPISAVIEATQILHSYMERILPPQYDLILDNPWETEDDLVATLRLLLKIPKPYGLNLYSLTFFPGTDLYKRAKLEGLIVDDTNEIYRKHYFEFERTYLNGVFILFSIPNIPRWIMVWLLSERMHRLRWNVLPYLIADIWFLGRMLNESIKSLLRRDFNAFARAIWFRLGRRMSKGYASIASPGTSD